ncbi:hypothetical protein [Pseudactinotalea sp.]|uniref:hypothetical protein n=1 Tax=Pseudactinotalea sp. TaxID=1926260 RepID=UPI003B3A152A
MTASIIHDPDFPHGTPVGFTNGCRGSHCPAVLPCRDVHRRYQGEWEFRRAIDAGTPLAQILEEERKAVQEAADAALAARKARTHAARRERANQARRKARAGTRPTPAKHGGELTEYQQQIKTLNQDGLTDAQIAERLGKTRNQIKAVRTYIGLKPNHKPTVVPRVIELIREGHANRPIAEALGIHHRYVATIRRQEASTTVGASLIHGGEA